MRIGFCQYHVTRNPEENIRVVERLLTNCEADLVVLPELAFSGYYFDSRKALDAIYNNESHQAVMQRMLALAKREKTTIVFGTVERAVDKRHNTIYVVDDSGILGSQRKMTRTVNEAVFDAGDQLAIIDVKGIKIGIITCFDTWFPEAARVLALQGAQLLCAPSNFGGPWTKDVVKVRALENGVHAVLTNRIGSEIIDGEAAVFRGESLIVDAHGDVLAEAGREEQVMVVEVDVSKNPRRANLICDDVDAERAKFSPYVRYDFDK